jgi:hypothetical protein
MKRRSQIRIPHPPILVWTCFLFFVFFFFAIIVIFNYINFVHFFIFISGAYVFPFFVLDPYFFLSNLYIIFYSNDYFSFVNFILNLGNNSEFLFIETQTFNR